MLLLLEHAGDTHTDFRHWNLGDDTLWRSFDIGASLLKHLLFSGCSGLDEDKAGLLAEQGREELRWIEPLSTFAGSQYNRGISGNACQWHRSPNFDNVVEKSAINIKGHS